MHVPRIYSTDKQGVTSGVTRHSGFLQNSLAGNKNDNWASFPLLMPTPLAVSASMGRRSKRQRDSLRSPKQLRLSVTKGFLMLDKSVFAV